MTQERTLFINQQPLFYRTAGQGQPVMLVHGFGEDGCIWEKQVDFLSEHFLVIVPDLPGSGHSALNNDVSMDGMATILKTLLEALQIPSCIMIGHSMGGYVALAFAEKNPGMLQALGLFHSTAYADSEEKKTNRRRSITFIREHGAAKFLEQAVPNLFGDTSKKEQPQLVKNMIEEYEGFLPESLIAYYEAMIQRPDRIPVLQSFPRPVLFVMGASDTAIPVQQGLQQCYLPVISQVEILKNSGHMGMLEEPDEANSLLLNFCTLA